MWTWSTIDASGAFTGTLEAAGRWPGIPLVCDANGDGIDAPAVWSAGLFEPGDGPAIPYGSLGFTQAVCGDWDGNGTDTPGLYRDGTCSLRNKARQRPRRRHAEVRLPRLAEAVAADWNHDGRDGIGLCGVVPGKIVRATP